MFCVLSIEIILFRVPKIEFKDSRMEFEGIINFKVKKEAKRTSPCFQFQSKKGSKKNVPLLPPSKKGSKKNVPLLPLASHPCFQ
jgi:hypothetical protein